MKNKDEQLFRPCHAINMNRKMPREIASMKTGLKSEETG